MQPNKQLAMCTSNEEAVKTLVENVKRYLRDNPRVKVVGVIVEDGTGWSSVREMPPQTIRIPRRPSDPTLTGNIRPLGEKIEVNAFAMHAL